MKNLLMRAAFKRIRTKSFQAIFCSDARPLLILLVLGDSAFLLVHIFHKIGPYFATCIFDINLASLGNPLLNIEYDNGYAEAYQYLKYFWIAGVLTRIIFVEKSYPLFPWVLLFLYFLCDDMLKIHEFLGTKIASFINVPVFLNVRFQDLGELTVSILVGGLISPLMIVGFYKANASERCIYLNLVLLVFCLAGFGVFVDFLHSASTFLKINFILGMVEDWGEMLVASVSLSYVFALKIRSPENRIFISRFR